MKAMLAVAGAGLLQAVTSRSMRAICWQPQGGLDAALSELCGRGDLALLGCLDAAQIPSKASQSVQGV